MVYILEMIIFGKPQAFQMNLFMQGISSMIAYFYANRTSKLKRRI